MEGLTQIMPNCYIVTSESDFKQLCDKLHCRKEKGFDKGHKDWWNGYEIFQITDKEEAFIKKDIVLSDDEGKEETCTSIESVQYPVSYPFLLTIDDDTYESFYYYFYIRYISLDSMLKDIPDIRECCLDYEERYK